MATQTINGMPTLTSAFFTQLQEFLRDEDADRSRRVAPPMVTSGGTAATSGTLTTTITACAAIAHDGFVVEQGNTAITVTASRRTYVFLDSQDSRSPEVSVSSGPGTFKQRLTRLVVIESPASSAPPTLSVDLLPLLYLDSSAVAITTVRPLRRPDEALRRSFPSGTVPPEGVRVVDVSPSWWQLDDAAAVQAAVDYYPGAHVRLASGTYTFNTGVTISGRHGTVIQGNSDATSGGTVINYTPTTGSVFTINASDHAGLQYLDIQYANVPTAGSAVSITGDCYCPHVRNVRVDRAFNGVVINSAREADISSLTLQSLFGQIGVHLFASSLAQAVYGVHVDNLHTDNPYPVSAGGTIRGAWAASTSYVVGDIVTNDSRIYQCVTGGISGNLGGPTGNSAGFSSDMADGTAEWRFVSRSFLAWISMDSFSYALRVTGRTLIRGGTYGFFMGDALFTGSSLPAGASLEGVEMSHTFNGGLGLFAGQSVWCLHSTIGSVRTGHGVAIESTHRGDIQIVDSRINGNAQHGIVVLAGPTNIDIIENKISNNSQALANTSHGVAFIGACRAFKVKGNDLGATLGALTNSQHTGLFVDVGCSEYVIEGNNFIGNTTFGYTDNSGQAARRAVHGNIGATSIPQNGVWMLESFAGANFGAKLSNAVSSLPSTGGTIDARGFFGAQTATATITINKPVTLLLGETTLTSTASPMLSISNPSGQVHIYADGRFTTVFQMQTATQDGISVNSNFGVMIDGLHFETAGGAIPKTAGRAILIDGPAVDVNSTIRNCTFNEQWECIRFVKSVGCRIENCEFFNTRSVGVWVQHTTSPDSGDHSITGCIFNTSLGGVGTCIHQVSGGGLKVIDNRFFFHSVAYQLDIQGSTNELMFALNKASHQTFAAINMTRSSGVATMSHVMIQGNWIGRRGIFIGTNGGAWLQQLMIQGNDILIDANQTGIVVNGADIGTISGNIFVGEGNTVGINLGAATARMSVGPNTFDSVTTPVSNTSLSTIMQPQANTIAPLDGQVGLVLYANNGGVLAFKQVIMGAPNSGGAGFRLLAVLN